MSRLTQINNPTTINPDGANPSLNITSSQTVIDNSIGTEVRINGATALNVKDSISMTAAENNDILLQTSGTGQVIIPNLYIDGMRVQTLSLPHNGTPLNTSILMNGGRSISIFATAQGDGVASSNAAGQYSVVKRDDTPISVNIINQIEGNANDVFEFDVDGDGNFYIKLTDSAGGYTNPNALTRLAIYGF